MSEPEESRTGAVATASDWARPTAYERWYASSLGRAYGASLQRVLSSWLAAFPESRILDIGCGPGLMERMFPAKAEVVGMDCSPEMVRTASSRWRNRGLARRFVVGSVEDMPFEDGSFDLAFCINCLEFVDNRDAAFAEIARVLRPGGAAILGVLNRRSIWELTRRAWQPVANRPYYQGRFFTEPERRRKGWLAAGSRPITRAASLPSRSCGHTAAGRG